MATAICALIRCIERKDKFSNTIPLNYGSTLDVASEALSLDGREQTISQQDFPLNGICWDWSVRLRLTAKILMVQQEVDSVGICLRLRRNGRPAIDSSSVIFDSTRISI